MPLVLYARLQITHHHQEDVGGWRLEAFETKMKPDGVYPYTVYLVLYLFCVCKRYAPDFGQWLGVILMGRRRVEELEEHTRTTHAHILYLFFFPGRFFTP